MIYPENLPISTVKFLWVRVDDFNLPWQAYSDTKTFGFKMLPQEARGLLDNIERTLRDLAYSELDAIYDQELISAIDLLEGEGYDDIVKYIRKLLNMTDEQRFELDRDDHMEMLLDAYGWIHDDWFQDNVLADKTRWGKLEISKAPSLLSNRIEKNA